jgi:nucleotide-binding universal stress UspA family protein
MYDTILVPLDGSKRAEAILPHVQKIARMGNSRVILMKSVEQRTQADAASMRSQVTSSQEEQQAKAAKIYLDDTAEEMRRMDIQTECRVVNGAPVEMIIKVAEEENAELIAIASHGRSGLSRVFYGSIAAGVLQAVDRPLLVIRSRNV